MQPNEIAKILFDSDVEFDFGLSDKSYDDCRNQYQRNGRNTFVDLVDFEFITPKVSAFNGLARFSFVYIVPFDKETGEEITDPDKYIKKADDTLYYVPMVGNGHFKRDGGHFKSDNCGITFSKDDSDIDRNTWEVNQSNYGMLSEVYPDLKPPVKMVECVFVHGNTHFGKPLVDSFTVGERRSFGNGFIEDGYAHTDECGLYRVGFGKGFVLFKDVD